jgi:uncharacterized Zn finger protein
MHNSLAKRGPVGTTPLAKSWLALLLTADEGRLARGRLYARAGNVTNLAIENGAIHALVQGSEGKSYDVTIRTGIYPLELWDYGISSLIQKPLFLAQLLAGTIPPDINSAFIEPLMPTNLDDLTLECTCYDSSAPCKHVLATMYLFGHILDTDPFQIFALRGIQRAILTEVLTNAYKKSIKPPETELETFWHKAELPEPEKELFDEPATRILLDELPWKLGTQKLSSVLAKTYTQCKERAAELLFKKDE